MIGGQSAQSLERLGSQLLQRGRHGEAIGVYERLVALRPDKPDDWYNLGYLQRRARRFEAALASFQRALDLGIRDPQEVHVNRSVILDHLERQDEAEAELRAALAACPNFLPALLNLGVLQEDRGARSEASATYEQVLAIAPNHAVALARLAGLTPVSGPDDPLIGRLRQALSGPQAPLVDKASLGFALGHALDGAGAYDEAYAAFVSANRANQASAGSAGPSYDAEAQEGFVDRLIKAFPESVAGSGDGDRPPIFICGMFRSGSTLVEQILAAHSLVTSGGELDLLPKLIGKELKPYPEALAAAGPERIDELRQAYLSDLRGLHPTAGSITDKRPDNFLHIGLIKTLFPQAKIVHTHRNPLDNCLSVYFLHLNPRIGYAHELLDIGHWYRQYRRLMAHWQALYAGDILNVDYDALVSDPRPAIERLLDFCGLGWEESCLNFHAAGGVVKTASLWQVRRPLYRHSSGRWRNYERHLADLRSCLEGLSRESPDTDQRMR